MIVLRYFSLSLLLTCLGATAHAADKNEDFPALSPSRPARLKALAWSKVVAPPPAYASVVTAKKEEAPSAPAAAARPSAAPVAPLPPRGPAIRTELRADTVQDDQTALGLIERHSFNVHKIAQSSLSPQELFLIGNHYRHHFYDASALENARLIFRHLSKKAPEGFQRSEALRHLAKMASRRGDKEEAQKLFEHSTQEDPRNTRAYLSYAEFLIHQVHDRPKGIHTYQTAIATARAAKRPFWLATALVEYAGCVEGEEHLAVLQEGLKVAESCHYAEMIVRALVGLSYTSEREDKANSYLMRSLKMCQEKNFPDKFLEGTVYLAMGHARLGGEQVSHFKKAIEIAEKTGDRMVHARALTGISNALVLPPAERIPYAREAVRVARMSQIPRNIAMALITHANTDRENPQRIDWYLEALEHTRTSHKDLHVTALIALTNANAGARYAHSALDVLGDKAAPESLMRIYMALGYDACWQKRPQEGIEWFQKVLKLEVGERHHQKAHEGIERAKSQRKS